MLQAIWLLAQDSPRSEPWEVVLRNDTLIPIVAIIGGLLVTLVWVFMHYFYSWLELCKNSELKLRMVEAGHSADEIERVLRAGQDADSANSGATPPMARSGAIHVPPAKPVPQHVA
jgi:hypothetical protein